MTQGDMIDFPSRVEPSRSTKENFFNGNPFKGLDKMTELVTGNHKNDTIKKNNFSNSSTTTNPSTKPVQDKKAKTADKAAKEHFDVPLTLALAGYISYLILFLVSYIREMLYGSGPMRGDPDKYKEKNRDGYSPLYASFESFYTRNIYRRLKNVFNQPIASVPGAKVTLIDRESDDDYWSFRMIESRRECINLGSYNYLGFAENDGPCTQEAIKTTRLLGLSPCSSRHELGTLEIHRKLESTVAEFIGAEDAIVFGMGFATNSLNLPQLINKDCLVISDEFNHASLILGLRLSGATVNVFKHNNIESLERILRGAIIRGHPRTRRPWKKIFIVVEGIYSMEGTIVKLPEIVALKKKYGAYLYLDEAHSVGAMGPRGRGIVDYFGLDPKDIDILMGTFTKSFGSAGGYIAGSKQLIQYLRINSQAACYATSMSPPVAEQIIASMNLIMHGNGVERIRQLARNSKYFRKRLIQMGFVVYGHDDSPVVPLMLFMPAKIAGFVTACLEYNLATVGVGFPATKMTQERARFCISAGHTKEMLDEALAGVDKVGDHIHLKYARSNLRPEDLEEVIY